MAGGRHSGITASIFTQEFLYYHFLTKWFLSSITDSNKQWAISHSCPQIWAYGIHLLKLHGGHLTSSLYLHSFRCIQSCKGSQPPSSKVRAWGDVEKPQQDMAFVLIAWSLAIRYKWVFGLTTVWVHSHQAHLPTLAEAVQKLMLLASEGTNWPYAYTWMNDAMAHTPLYSEGHIGIKT